MDPDDVEEDIVIGQKRSHPGMTKTMWIHLVPRKRAAPPRSSNLPEMATVKAKPIRSRSVDLTLYWWTIRLRNFDTLVSLATLSQSCWRSSGTAEWT
jgi:hypothetical protein